MPFIFNDDLWQIIENEKEYDRTVFSVVYKLFIRLNEGYVHYLQEAKNFNEASIVREFRKFGEIKSVEMLNNGKKETYVTFADDRSAALAYSITFCENEQFNKHLIHKKWFIEPANTWHQPSHQPHQEMITNDLENVMDVDDDIEIEMPPIFNLNEDCFYHLFTFCDIESLMSLRQVCKSFNTKLLGDKCFRRFHTLLIYVNVNEYMTLGVARKLLRRVGKYIKKIDFEFDDSTGYMNLHRYLEKMNQYVGENIQELIIPESCLVKENLPMLKPILKRLHVLQINSWLVGGLLYSIDLKTFCPNLVNLKLNTDIHITDIYWPKLRFLSIQGGNERCSFIEQNRHLEGLKIMLSIDEQIQVIVDNLLCLQKLAVCNSRNHLTVAQLNDLLRLNNLTQLTLSFLSDTAFDVIVQNLKNFKKLRVLKLHIDSHIMKNDFVPDQNGIIDLIKNLLHLEKLLLLDIELKSSTLVGIIQFATNLKIFHFHYCRVQLDDSLIWRIMNARKSLEHQRPIKLFVDNIEDWDKFLDKEVQRYLQADFGCCHANFFW